MAVTNFNPDRRRIAVNLLAAMLLIGSVVLGLAYRLAQKQRLQGRT